MTDSTRLEDLLRELAPQVLGPVVRRLGDFAAAEDAVQEALLAAAQHWPEDGLPDNPRGWLITAAVRRGTDAVRSDVSRRRREVAAALAEPDEREVPDQDDTLTLLFLCCHPALTPGSAIPLTLRAVGGLTTAEIAKAFLVPESTMAQRISRAKARISASGHRFAMPEPGEVPQRLRSVLHVLYLIYNEGYATSGGPDLQRTELSAEAIRLTRALHGLLPDTGEVGGLLALLLLTDARRTARTGPAGELIPLSDQDRSLWDQDLITEGVAMVVEAMSKGAVGEYQIQAAIAALHDEAPRPQDTDWSQILALYTLLERVTKNPMVSLNRAVAAAMAHGPAAGLELLAPLEKPLAGNHRLAAVRAHLLEMAGNAQEAAVHYRTAASLTANEPERHYLLTQAAKLNSREPASGRLDPPT